MPQEVGQKESPCLSVDRIMVPGTHARDEAKSGDEEPKMKRRRAKRTCLACKSRKTKCDKSYPCAPCVVRGEKHACDYEDDVEPAARRQAMVPLSDHIALRTRLDRVEKALQSHASPSSESKPTIHPPLASSLDCHPDRHRAADQERTLRALEGLSSSALGSVRRPGAQGEAELFPNIVVSSSAQRSNKWMRDMSDILTGLPDKVQMEVIVDFYLSEMQVMRRYLVEAVFRSELSQFAALRSLNLSMSVDPAWLAQLASVLWVSCHLLVNEPTTSPARINLGLVNSELIDLACRLFETLETALTCAGWLYKPQVRILQAVSIALSLNTDGPYTGAFHGPLTDPTRWLWFDIGVGIIKGMRLHILNTFEDLAKLQDLAAPASRPFYSTEILKRAVYDIVYLDSFAVCATPEMPRKHAPYCFPDGSITIPEPGNYSDEALLSLNPVQPRDIWEKTCFVWGLHTNIVAAHWRRISVALEETENLTYDTLLQHSQSLLESHQQFLTIKATQDLNPKEIIVFAALNSSYLQRFLRLHRPYLLQSYRNDRYLQSRNTVLSAARQIAGGHRKLLGENGNSVIVRNSMFLFVHHISAVLVLFINAVCDPESKNAMRDECLKSSEVFWQALSKGNRPVMRWAIKGFCVTAELLQLLDGPPNDPNRIEAIMRGIEAPAMARERALLTEMTKKAEVPMSIVTDLKGGGAEDWDFDWNVFIRDL